MRSKWTKAILIGMLVALMAGIWLRPLSVSAQPPPDELVVESYVFPGRRIDASTSDSEYRVDCQYPDQKVLSGGYTFEAIDPGATPIMIESVTEGNFTRIFRFRYDGAAYWIFPQITCGRLQ